MALEGDAEGRVHGPTYNLSLRNVLNGRLRFGNGSEACGLSSLCESINNYMCMFIYMYVYITYIVYICVCWNLTHTPDAAGSWFRSIHHLVLFEVWMVGRDGFWLDLLLVTKILPEGTDILT